MPCRTQPFLLCQAWNQGAEAPFALPEVVCVQNQAAWTVRTGRKEMGGLMERFKRKDSWGPGILKPLRNKASSITPGDRHQSEGAAGLCSALGLGMVT
jgi:hypothetical protein